MIHTVAFIAADPASAASAAAMIGTPGGATGINANVITTASAQTRRAPGRCSSTASNARKNAGKIASRPSASGLVITPPASTPAIVPSTQAGYCASVDPSSNGMSKRPSPRLASAQDASTSAWPRIARPTAR